jgi:hypothetical protein
MGISTEVDDIPQSSFVGGSPSRDTPDGGTRMQLEAQWVGNKVRISRDGVRLVDVQSKTVTRGKDWLKLGNGKTEGMVGIISCLAGGCFRSCTGFTRCTESCYSKADGSCGCYADATLHAEFRKSPKHFKIPYSVIWNGVQPGTESWFKVKVPKSFDLSMYPRKVWRVDSETSTSCLSLALGLTQRFAEANPTKLFMGISSAYFHVPDEMLEWAARCGNVQIGVSLSSWFSPEELLNRVEQSIRYQRFGVPTSLWVVQNPQWDMENPESKRIVDEAVGMSDPRRIIALGYHDHGTHLFADETVNPWGACCTNRYSKEGERLSSPNMTVSGEPYKGIPYGRCAPSCKLMCGASWLRICQREA